MTGKQPAGNYRETRSTRATALTNKEPFMLKWAIIFFVISLIAGLFGFTGVSSGAKSIAKVLFVIAMVIFLVVLVFGVFLGMLVF